MKIDIVGKRYWWFALSLVFILPGLFSIVTEGLKLGIDFTGGTIWELQMSNRSNHHRSTMSLSRSGMATHSSRHPRTTASSFA